MLNVLPIILLISLLFGLLAGIPLTIASHRHKPIRSGILAHIFHYLAASAAATTPIATLSLVITRGIQPALLTAIGLTAALYLFAVLYAITEQYNTRWTAKDAPKIGQ